MPTSFTRSLSSRNSLSADREAYCGDPNFCRVPMTELLSDGYNDERRRLLTGTASMELRPGSIPGIHAGRGSSHGAARRAAVVRTTAVARASQRSPVGA